jgi:hypothetical protein
VGVGHAAHRLGTLMDSAPATRFHADDTLDQLCNKLLHNWLPIDRKVLARVCASGACTKPIAARQSWPESSIGSADRIVQQSAAQMFWFHRLLRCYVVVEYALRDLTKPIGVANFETRLLQSLPAHLRGSLPTIEEIERELERGESGA